MAILCPGQIMTWYNLWRKRGKRCVDAVGTKKRAHVYWNM